MQVANFKNISTLASSINKYFFVVVLFEPQGVTQPRSKTPKTGQPLLSVVALLFQRNQVYRSETAVVESKIKK